MTHTTPYHQFKESIAWMLMDDKIFNAEWFETQGARLSLYWSVGESAESAYETVKAFAVAATKKSISPTDPRICLGIERI